MTSGLGSCATDQGSFNGCDLIKLKAYSDQFTKNFVDQWNKIPEGSELDVYIKDSMDLKDSVIACRGKR